MDIKKENLNLIEKFTTEILNLACSNTVKELEKFLKNNQPTLQSLINLQLPDQQNFYHILFKKVPYNLELPSLTNKKLFSLYLTSSNKTLLDTQDSFGNNSWHYLMSNIKISKTIVFIQTLAKFLKDMQKLNICPQLLVNNHQNKTPLDYLVKNYQDGNLNGTILEKATKFMIFDTFSDHILDRFKKELPIKITQNQYNFFSEEYDSPSGRNFFDVAGDVNMKIKTVLKVLQIEEMQTLEENCHFAELADKKKIIL